MKCRWAVLLVVAVALTDKEAVLFLTRLAALDNVMLGAGPARELWQKTFVDLLYTMCTKVVPPHVGSALCTKVVHLSAWPSIAMCIEVVPAYVTAAMCTKAVPAL